MKKDLDVERWILVSAAQVGFDVDIRYHQESIHVSWVAHGFHLSHNPLVSLLSFLIRQRIWNKEIRPPHAYYEIMKGAKRSNANNTLNMINPRKEKMK